MVARVPYPGLDETTNTIDRSGFADDIVMPFEDDLSAQIGLDGPDSVFNRFRPKATPWMTPAIPNQSAS